MKTRFIKGLFIATTLVVGIFLMSLAPIKPSKQHLFESISKKIEDHSISAEIVGKGGHQENCISFSLKNKTPDTLYIMLEPGRTIVSEDSSFQDIFIVKEKRITLPPLATVTTDGYGFCCRAHRSSPAKKSKFNIGYMSPVEWVEVASVINVNHFPTNAIQNAVWVLSDNFPIASIHHEKMEEIELLRTAVAKAKGITLPWYTISYEKDTVLLFSNRPEKLHGKIAYYVNRNAIITINIRSSKGQLMTTLIQEEAKNPGNQEFKLDLDIRNWAKGNYDICVYEDYSNLNFKKRFTIE